MSDEHNDRSQPNLSALLQAVSERAPAPSSAARDEALQRLADLVANPNAVPPIGVKASEAMRGAFANVAKDIERIAQEHVDRASALLQEALSFASVVRNAGDVLCGRIEEEATRGYQVSEALLLARFLIGEDRQAPVPAEEPQGRVIPAPPLRS